MKIRSGFVSNSSSSSFIFGIKRSPKNANELLPLLYPGMLELSYHDKGYQALFSFLKTRFESCF